MRWWLLLMGLCSLACAGPRSVVSDACRYEVFTWAFGAVQRSTVNIQCSRPEHIPHLQPPGPDASYWTLECFCPAVDPEEVTP